jgi:hypothetical protein
MLHGLLFVVVKDEVDMRDFFRCKSGGEDLPLGPQPAR